MQLIPNWRKVLRWAWSVRLLVLAGLLSGAEVLMQFFADDPPLPRGTFAILTMLTTAAAFVARMIAQQSVSGQEDDEE